MYLNCVCEESQPYKQFAGRLCSGMPWSIVSIIQLVIEKQKNRMCSCCFYELFHVKQRKQTHKIAQNRNCIKIEKTYRKLDEQKVLAKSLIDLWFAIIKRIEKVKKNVKRKRNDIVYSDQIC